MEEAKYFLIGDKKFQFYDNDIIFKAERPAERVNIEDGFSECLCCELKFKSAKNVSYW